MTTYFDSMQLHMICPPTKTNYTLLHANFHIGSTYKSSLHSITGLLAGVIWEIISIITYFTLKRLIWQNICKNVK